jgi:ATP-binding cassette subfamily B multidrug efflux pump
LFLQDNYLFRGTLADNIAYGRPGASEQAIAEAARQANADTFITKLEGGFHFKISEGGSNLSQGERQLIAIARTLLADPQLLILDEATSAVDSRTERHIQQAMDELMKNRSSIVIAHRLSTIEKADTILYLENGAVVERGSHNELLAARGAYYRLYMSQFDGELQV